MSCGKLVTPISILFGLLALGFRNVGVIAISVVLATIVNHLILEYFLHVTRQLFIIDRVSDVRRLNAWIENTVMYWDSVVHDDWKLSYSPIVLEGVPTYRYAVFVPGPVPVDHIVSLEGRQRTRPELDRRVVSMFYRMRTDTRDIDALLKLREKAYAKSQVAPLAPLRVILFISESCPTPLKKHVDILKSSKSFLMTFQEKSVIAVEFSPRELPADRTWADPHNWTVSLQEHGPIMEHTIKMGDISLDSILDTVLSGKQKKRLVRDG